MKQEIELKIQSWLDGELSAAEAKEVAALITADAELSGLMTELRQTKTTLAGNELELKVPDTREFYWSQIARGIEREERKSAQPASVPFIVQFRKFFMPFAGLAAVVAIGLLTLNPAAPSFSADSNASSGDMETVTFRDHESGMTVVWLKDRTDESQASETDDTSKVETQ